MLRSVNSASVRSVPRQQAPPPPLEDELEFPPLFGNLSPLRPPAQGPAPPGLERSPLRSDKPKGVPQPRRAAPCSPERLGQAPPIRRPLQGDGETDSWSGRGFLERVVLSASAAAGMSRKDVEKMSLWKSAQRGDAAAMKVESGSRRGRWILSNGSRLDAQLSFIGRSLPPAGRDAVKAALAQHQVDFSTPHATPPQHLSGCREFVAKWARRRLVKPRVAMQPPAWPSGSSCIERSSAKGGTLSFLLEEISKLPPCPEALPTTCESADLHQDALMLRYAFGRMEEEKYPEHRIACLAERGLKTRVVNVGPAWCQVLGHSVRKRLLGGLRATPGAFQPLKGASDREIIELFSGSVGDVLVSTDLTRATDLLPHDLVRAAVDGLRDSGMITAMELEVLEALSGPQLLHYPDGKTLLSSRGILMGLPTSWCLLSLIHLYWLDVSNRAAREASGKRKPRLTASICGDDALLATTRAGADAYKTVVRECGGSPSDGKHYECSSGPLRRGVFLEKLIEFVVSNDGRLSLGSRYPAIPVKGLTSKNLARDFCEDRLVSCRSFGIRQVLTLDAICTQNECLVGPCRDYMSRRASWLPRYTREVLGLAGGFPLNLGGFILSPRRPGDELIAIQVRDSGRSFSLAVQRDVDPLWRLASQFSSEGRALAVEEGELVDLPLRQKGRDPAGDPPPREGWVVVSEESRSLATVLPIYRQLVGFSSGPSRRTIHMRAQDFSRALLRLRAEGRARPTGLPAEVLLDPLLIEWRLPNGEAPERGTSWYSASKHNRSVMLNDYMVACGATRHHRFWPPEAVKS